MPAFKAGLGINRKYLGFGVGFFDYDNDGWKDLFLANGNVYSQIADRKLHLSYKEPKGRRIFDENRRYRTRNSEDGRTGAFRGRATKIRSAMI